MSRMSEVTLLRVVVAVLCNALVATSSCPEEMKTNIGGVLTSLNYNDISKENGSCTHRISSRNGYMEMQLLDIVHQEMVCPCCVSLKVSSDDGEEFLYCANVNLTKLPLSFHGYDFQVSYKVPGRSRSSIKWNYTTSRRCRAMEFECDDRLGCYGRTSICDKKTDCYDQSDEVRCARRVCKNDMKKDRFFMCANGDCIDTYLVNNGIRDCRDGSDEKSLSTSYVILITVVLFSLFAMLICRWYVFRRDVGRLMEDMPEFPLPPFRAPGDRQDDSEETRISEADLQSGGEIFESYVESRRNSDSCQRHRIRRVKSKEKRRLIDASHGDDSIVALASLSLDPSSCIGLSKENIARINSATSSSIQDNDVMIQIDEK